MRAEKTGNSHGALLIKMSLDGRATHKRVSRSRQHHNIVVVIIIITTTQNVTRRKYLIAQNNSDWPRPDLIVDYEIMKSVRTNRSTYY